MKASSSEGHLILGLGAIVFAALGLCLWAPFQYDDISYLIENPDVIGPWPGWRHWLTSFYEGNYEPVVFLLHRLLYALAGDKVLPYRLVGLSLHWATAALALRFYRRSLGPGSHYFLLAALFALHPAHAEVLAVATFKKHMLVAFFGLCLMELKDEFRPGPFRSVAAWAAMGMALGCKESALILPGLLLITEAGPARRRDRVLYGGLVALCAGYLAFRLTRLPPVPSPAAGLGLGGRMADSGQRLLWHLAELIAPISLCFEHSLPAVAELASWRGVRLLAGLGVWAALGAAAWRLDRIVALAWAWCTLSLAPYLNVPAVHSMTTVANRYLYLSSVGFILGLGRIIQLLPNGSGAMRLQWKPWLLGCLGIVYLAIGMPNLVLYGDPLDLWRHALTCAPDHPRARYGLGVAYQQRGRYAQAAEEFRKAMAFSPPYYLSTPMAGLAMAYEGMGRRAEALDLARRAADANPMPAVLQVLAFLQSKNSQCREALPLLERVSRLEPANGEIMLNLGQCYLDLGDPERAEEVWRRGLNYAPPRVRELISLRLKGLLAPPTVPSEGD